MPKAKPTKSLQGESVTRAKVKLASLTNQYWHAVGRPLEVHVVNRQFYRLVQQVGFDLTELINQLVVSGELYLVVLTNLKRFLIPGAIWRAMELEAKTKLIAKLELEYVQLRSNKRVNLPENDPEESNAKLNPNNEPFFTNLNRANPNNEVSDAD